MTMMVCSPTSFPMDTQRAEGHPVDISADVASEENNRYAGTKGCGGAPCGFADAKTSSREAKERSASMWKLWGGVILCFIFMGVQVFGGIKANTLAILTDAAHLLSDVAAFWYGRGCAADVLLWKMKGDGVGVG
ncbi:putative cation efflux transmembrane domain superfamily [Helianthus annuus]|nr:putative cation efflux transmembrane domain superfamily [Helianthus annuus]KAJ0617883.1 putative cation efflux transmembrane domain superfamily [Helianthus annuus]